MSAIVELDTFARQRATLELWDDGSGISLIITEDQHQQRRAMHADNGCSAQMMPQDLAEQVGALQEHVRVLEAQLVDAHQRLAQPIEIAARITPQDARTLAAVLEHFAAEDERRWR